MYEMVETNRRVKGNLGQIFRSHLGAQLGWDLLLISVRGPSGQRWWLLSWIWIRCRLGLGLEKTGGVRH